MDADELYCLPLDEFVPRRDALVKELRAEGRKEDAAAVAKLPKPSVAAWAVNQVVRAQAREAEALWTAGDEVLDVQARVVEGEATGADLREAIEKQRAALEPLADAARGLLTGAGRFLGEAQVQAVVETLHAAAVDPAAREDVAAARAARPLRLTGLEAVKSGPAQRRAGGGGDATKTPGGGGAKTREGGGAKTRRSEDAEASRARIAERTKRDSEEEKARRAAEAAEAKRLKEAQRAVARAERDRDAARDRVQRAVKRRDEAAIKVEQAEAELARAENARAEAHEQLEAAEETVDVAQAALDDLAG